MQKVSRQIIRELLWLIISLGLTTGLAFFLFGRHFLRGTVDIHLHDTFVVMAVLHILLPMFLLITFFIYFLKEIGNSFSQALPNQILLSTGLILIIALTLLIKVFWQFSAGGWTLYPPLSGLGPNEAPKLAQMPVTKVIANFLTVVQLLILAMLLFFVYHWGKRKTK